MSSESTERIAAAMRSVIANAVLTNERIARSVGLNVVDLQTLSVITMAEDGLSAGEISKLTALPTSTMTRVLDRLADAGFITRKPDATDRRRLVIRADQRKLRSMSAAYAGVMAGMEALHMGFSEEELLIVARYLEQMGASGLN